MASCAKDHEASHATRYIPIHPIYRWCHSSIHILQGIWGLYPNVVLVREIWSCLCASVGYVYNSTGHFDKSILRTTEWPWQPYTIVCIDIPYGDYTLWQLSWSFVHHSIVWWIQLFAYKTRQCNMQWGMDKRNKESSVVWTHPHAKKKFTKMNI